MIINANQQLFLYGFYQPKIIDDGAKDTFEAKTIQSFRRGSHAEQEIRPKIADYFLESFCRCMMRLINYYVAESVRIELLFMIEHRLEGSKYEICLRSFGKAVKQTIRELPIQNVLKHDHILLEDAVIVA